MWQTTPCYRCGAPNYMGQRFCSNCGINLVPTCPYCGVEINPGVRFCNNCGAPQGGPPQAGPPMQQQMPVRSPDFIDQIGIWIQSAIQRITSLSTTTYLIILLCGIVIGIGGILYWQFGPGIKQPDLRAPNISNVTATSIGKYSATIMWYTDEPASGQVEYGTSSSYGLTTPAQPQNDPTQGYEGTTQHTVYLSRLPSNTTHHYRVKSIDVDGNEQTSGDYTFKTDEVEDFFQPADD